MEGIRIRYRRLGPVTARANHRTGETGLNSDIYPRLDPLMREFVMLHELVHLQNDVYDEAECNRIAARTFLSRAASEGDLRRRSAFLQPMFGGEECSNFIGALLGVVGVVAGGILGLAQQDKASDAQEDAERRAQAAYEEARNMGYYSLTTAQRKDIVNEFLSDAFRIADGSVGVTPKSLFWAEMSRIIFKTEEASYEYWRMMPGNDFAESLIAQYEEAYGLGFEGSRTCLDKTSVKAAIAVLATVLAAAAYCKITGKTIVQVLKS